MAIQKSKQACSPAFQMENRKKKQQKRMKCRKMLLRKMKLSHKKEEKATKTKETSKNVAEEDEMYTVNSEYPSN